MSNVVAIHEVAPLERAVQEIHKHFADALDADGRAINHRIKAGQKLNDLRRRIEAGEAGVGVNWWQWYKSKFVRSRKDAEAVMRLANTDDPDAAEAERKEKKNTRERGQRAAAKNKGTEDASSIVDHALRLVEEMDATQREEFFARLQEKYAW